MSELRQKIKSEIQKTKTELIMSYANDGWWNMFMEEKLKELEEKLKEIDNDNDRILNKED